jgi:hypothetical protein
VASATAPAEGIGNVDAGEDGTVDYFDPGVASLSFSISLSAV